MDKGFWGPSTWCMIHTASAGFSPTYRVSFKQFIHSLPYLLPCEYCRGHLFQNLRTIPLDENSLDSNTSAFMWSYMLHDLVNKQLGKNKSPAFPIAQKYYFSNSGNYNLWGPCFWRALHSFAASYRPMPEVQRAFKEFVYSWPGILPCTTCKNQLTQNLKQMPLTDEYMRSAHTLFLWSYLLHDLVNKQLGKHSPPFEEVKAHYFNENVCSTCGR